MPAFIRLEHSTSWAFTAILSIALLAFGTPIASSAEDKADSNTPDRIVVANPNGGQVVAPRQGYTIRWCAEGTDTVRIEYSPDGGRTWHLISDAVPAITEDNFHCPKPLLEQYLPSTVIKNMGSYTWNVPDIESGDVLVRVIDKLRPSISDVSDKPFTITHGASTGWTQQSVGAAVTLWSVSIVDDSVAWTCGREGVVFRTTNGGSSWIQGSSLPTHVTSIFGLNVDTAFVCVNFTNDGRVYRTANGGISWSLVLQYTGTSASILNVHMFEEHKGIALGNPVGGLWRVFKTANGGLTWDTLSQVPESGYGFRNAVAWASELKGWFGTDGSLVYWTTDGGLTWTSSDLGSLDVFCLVFPSEQLGMVSTAFRYLYKTTNGGSSWSYVSVAPAPHPATIISFLAGVAVPTPRWWAASLDEIYRSTNHGMSWTFEALANGYPFNDISMKYIQEKGVIVGYAVAAADGVVMKYRETVTAVPEGPPHPLPSSSVELRQNYPNPFNPTTNLEFQIPKSEFVILRIYNILGQEVQTLVNERKEAGVHRVQFDAEGLTSGVYTYRIESGGRVASRMMLFLK